MFGTEIPTKQIALVKKLFPSYRKRNVRVVPSETVSFHDLNWSGGTRATYHAIDLRSESALSMVHWSTFAPWENPYEGAKVNLIPGFAVAESGFFCGKQSTLRLYVHPADMPKYLPAS